MVLVPLLTGKCGLSRRRAFATSVAVILPLCILSASIYWMRGKVDLQASLPYMAGGLAGGIVGGKLFKKVSVLWLRRIFALLILYGAWRSFV